MYNNVRNLKLVVHDNFIMAKRVLEVIFDKTIFHAERLSEFGEIETHNYNIVRILGDFMKAARLGDFEMLNKAIQSIFITIKVDYKARKKDYGVVTVDDILGFKTVEYLKALYETNGKEFVLRPY